MELSTIIKQLVDFGFSTVFIGLVLFLGYKYFDRKFFGQKFVERTRKINRDLDEQENEDSKRMIKKIQSYLNDNNERFKKMGIDRCSVWINHNGMRNGKIHFIFYSLIAEFCAVGLQKRSEAPTGSQKLPYYVFAEYEEMIIAKNGTVFIEDQDILSDTSKAIGSDMGIKSLIISPVFSMKGKIEGMILFSSVYNKLQQKPSVEHTVSDLRALFIS